MKVIVDAEVEVDPYDVLSEVSTAELAEMLKARRSRDPGTKVPDPIDIMIETIDRDAMEQALWHWNCGRTEDATYYLEKALGRRWAGLAECGRRRVA